LPGALLGIDVTTVADVVIGAGGYLCALLAAGGAAFAALAERRGASTRAARRIFAGAALLGLALVALEVSARAAFLGGATLAAALDPAMLRLVMASPAGTSAILRALGVLACLSLLARRRAGDGIAWLGSAAIVASFAASGHVLGDPRWALAPLVVIHTAAVAFWLAALPGLWLTVRREPNNRAARVVAAFGRRAQWVVAGLVAAGLGMLVLLAGSPAALVASDWGFILAGKIVAVAALMSLAAYNKLRLTPALSAAQPHASRALQRSIAAELALVLVVLIATAILTTTTPPAK
jgi:putative copper resistance protein D